MPGAVPVTSTHALTNVTLPYISRIAAHGWKAACQADPSLARGLSTVAGHLTSEPVARAWNLDYAPADQFLN